MKYQNVCEVCHVRLVSVLRHLLLSGKAMQIETNQDVD